MNNLQGATKKEVKVKSVRFIKQKRFIHRIMDNRTIRLIGLLLLSFLFLEISIYIRVKTPPFQDVNIWVGILSYFIAVIIAIFFVYKVITNR